MKVEDYYSGSQKWQESGLLEEMFLEGTTVLADRAYGKWALREYIADHNADFCIPPKSNESDPWYCDWWLYKERYLVENFFLKLKEFRRIATCYDKFAKRFLGYILLETDPSTEDKRFCDLAYNMLEGQDRLMVLEEPCSNIYKS